MLIKLQKLIAELDINYLTGDETTDIKGIAYDSREVKAGDLFVAITGFETDGHKYIADAISNGATAVLVEQEVSDLKVPTVGVKDSRSALAKISAKFYDYPAQELTVIGVTGTNGKTTTTYLIEGVLSNLGLNTGLIGTIKNKVGDKEESSSRTTPESLDIQRMLAEMLEDGVTHVVMEVSSHALALDRVLEVDFDRKIFTNLSRDHLDFHHTFEEYLAAKLKLFTSNNQPSIINLDDERAGKISSAVEGEVLTYGIEETADFRGENIEITSTGVHYDLITADNKLRINLSLTGKFNVYNSLAAITTVSSLGFELADIKSGIEEINGVPGRFEVIDLGQDYGVIVDYAHTPDGMKNVLKTAQECSTGDVIVVFGCGGDRDRKKRAMMGQLGIELADFAVVTSDNPRSEKPEDIIAEIEAGIEELEQDTSEQYLIVEERGAAIRTAVERAAAGDIVLIIGKGHETYQDFGDKVIDFDDREEA
ncbi:MAG: UDP-N-acetylmuramoyl-L-alanyl-D-glutamate--2,6-diaminopimelate ligase, partial [Bacillota bacterium]